MNLIRIEIVWDGEPHFYKVDRAAGLVFEHPKAGGPLLFVSAEQKAQVLKVLDEADALPEDVEEEKKPAARSDAILAWDRTLKHFIGKRQFAAIKQGMAGEECQFFFDMMVNLAAHIEAMPKVYAQDGLGDKAIVHLHYFRGSMDWHITERDTTKEQHQAFGLANLGYGGELGYISIAELIENHIELDLYWAPKPLAAVKAKEAA